MKRDPFAAIPGGGSHARGPSGRPAGWWAAACAAVALFASSPAAAQPAPPIFDLTELAEGVYAATVRPNPPMYVFANSLIVIGADGVLVVDAQASAAASRALLAQLAAVTPLPVTHVVNTHWHTDHTAGNAAFVDANPDVTIVATEATAEAMATSGRAAYQADIDTLPASAERRRAWAAEGRGPDGRELGAAAIESLRRSADLREAQARGLAATPYTLPHLTFRESLRIDLGGRRVEVRALGPAHTTGDAVVWLADERILAAGDLLEDAFPWIDADTDVAGWARALAHLEGLDPAVVLPAHGTVHRGRGFLRANADLLAAIVDAALTAENAAVDPHDHRYFAGLGVSADAFRAAFAAAVARTRGAHDGS